MTRRRMDVNCDIGETALPWAQSHEPELLGLITSANVACGGHAGDTESMRAVCTEARRLGVTIGAQVSYPDRENFGRVALPMDAAALADSLEEQLNTLSYIAQTVGTEVSYVKPHGALYNVVVSDEQHARVVVDLAARHNLALFGLPTSVTESLAHDAGIRFVPEWFADRAYLSNGQLVPRTRPDALVTSASAVVMRVRQLVTTSMVQAVDGHDASITCATICIHSDTPGAAALLRAVREGLMMSDISIESWRQ
jgi:UPF0271 protein